MAYGGADSAIWILDGFPFPIKASTWTHVSEGIAPQEYKFTLLHYNENVQQDPFADVVPTTTIQETLGCPNLDNVKFKSVKKATFNSHYALEILYKPEEPKQNCELEWLIKFKSKYDNTEFLNQVQYDIQVVKDVVSLTSKRSLALEDDRKFLYSPSGLAQRTMTINEPSGVNHFLILLYGLAPDFVVPDFDKTPTDFVVLPIKIKRNTDMSTSTTTTPIQEPEIRIPSWIKKNAGLWSDGTIDDSTFVIALEYLIQKRVIVIPISDTIYQGSTTRQ